MAHTRLVDGLVRDGSSWRDASALGLGQDGALAGAIREFGKVEDALGGDGGSSGDEGEERPHDRDERDVKTALRSKTRDGWS